MFFSTFPIHLGRPMLAAALGLLLAGPAQAVPPVDAAASSAAEPGRTVYQQRRADGQAVFTDRPAAGLVTERRWLIEPEDPEAASTRRDAVRANADRVTERIQRSIDQQQQLSNDLLIQQLRSQQAADALQAERLREYDNDYRPYGVLPGRPYYRPGIRPPPIQPTPRPRPPHSPRPSVAPEPMIQVGGR